jgi:hypothetical protein
VCRIFGLVKAGEREGLMGMSITKMAVVVAAACLAACASTQPRLYYNYPSAGEARPGSQSDSEFVYLNALAERVRSLACEAGGPCLPPAKADRSKKAPADPAAASQFLQAGMTLTDLLCLDHFNRALTGHKHRSYARTVLNDTNGLVSAIMGLTGAGSTATGIVGASFSYANSTTGDFEQNYMVSVDLASAQLLVQKAMAITADYHTKNVPRDYFQAERALARYASMCTFTGIQGLLAQAARAAEPSVTALGVEPTLQMTESPETHSEGHTTTPPKLSPPP